MKKWQKIGLSWAVWMYVIMIFVFPYFNREEITLKKALIGIPFWLIGGLAFGYSQRYYVKKKKEN